MIETIHFINMTTLPSKNIGTAVNVFALFIIVITRIIKIIWRSSSTCTGNDLVSLNDLYKMNLYFFYMLCIVQIYSNLCKVFM